MSDGITEMYRKSNLYKFTPGDPCYPGWLKKPADESEGEPVKKMTATEAAMLETEAENKELKEDILRRLNNLDETVIGLDRVADKIYDLRDENAAFQRAHDKNLEAGLKLSAENARLIQSIEGFEGEKRAWDKLSSENASLRARLEKVGGICGGPIKSGDAVSELKQANDRMLEIYRIARENIILPPSFRPTDGGEPGVEYSGYGSSTCTPAPATAGEGKKTASETVADSGRTLWHCEDCNETAPGCKCDRDVLAESDEGKPVKTAGEEKVVCGEEEVPIDEIIEGSAELPVKDAGLAPTLAPCPMNKEACGQNPHYDHDYQGRIRISCFCGISGPWENSPALAASAWEELCKKCNSKSIAKRIWEIDCKLYKADHALAERVRELYRRLNKTTMDLRDFGDAVFLTVFCEGDSGVDSKWKLVDRKYPPEADREGGDDGTG